MGMMINEKQEDILVNNMLHPNTHSYHKIYLDTMEELHKLLYVTLAKQDKDFFSLIDTYNSFSELRTYMDKGSQIALNSGHKQCLRSIPQELCFDKPKDQVIDIDIARWMGSIYNYMQWKHNILSKELCEHIPAKELYKQYENMKDLSKEEIIQKLYENYFVLKKQSEYKPYFKKEYLEIEKIGDERYE